MIVQQNMSIYEPYPVPLLHFLKPQHASKINDFTAHTRRMLYFFSAPDVIRFDTYSSNAIQGKK